MEATETELPQEMADNTCCLQEVVGEPPQWQESACKSAAKMHNATKQQNMFVNHKISKGRELMRRVSDGDVPKRPERVRPSIAEYC